VPPPAVRIAPKPPQPQLRPAPAPSDGGIKPLDLAPDEEAKPPGGSAAAAPEESDLTSLEADLRDRQAPRRIARPRPAPAEAPAPAPPAKPAPTQATPRVAPPAPAPAASPSRVAAPEPAPKEAPPRSSAPEPAPAKAPPQSAPPAPAPAPASHAKEELLLHADTPAGNLRGLLDDMHAQVEQLSRVLSTAHQVAPSAFWFGFRASFGFVLGMGALAAVAIGLMALIGVLFYPPAFELVRQLFRGLGLP
jgi:hypothetical protein